MAFFRSTCSLLLVAYLGIVSGYHTLYETYGPYSTSGSVSGDPHFVFKHPNVDHEFCVDVDGAGKVFKLYSDTTHRFTINAEIIKMTTRVDKEATYIGTVGMLLGNNKITITPKSVEVDGLLLPWKNMASDEFAKKQLHVQVDPTKILVNNSGTEVKVTRKVTANTAFLNIQIGMLKGEEADGLLGQCFSSVITEIQRWERGQQERGAFDVEGLFGTFEIFTTLVKKKDGSCWKIINPTKSWPLNLLDRFIVPDVLSG